MQSRHTLLLACFLLLLSATAQVKPHFTALAEEELPCITFDTPERTNYLLTRTKCCFNSTVAATAAAIAAATATAVSAPILAAPVTLRRV
jgi:hypothetical protein